MKLLTIQNIIDRNNLNLTNDEKRIFADNAKKSFPEGCSFFKVKEKHNGCKVSVNAYPDDFENQILKAGGFKKKRQRIKKFVLNN